MNVSRNLTFNILGWGNFEITVALSPVLLVYVVCGDPLRLTAGGLCPAGHQHPGTYCAADYDARYAKELGNFRIERITRVATRVLTCGDYPLSGSGVYSRHESCQGVARIRCSNPECHYEYFRPFSCRGLPLRRHGYHIRFWQAARYSSRLCWARGCCWGCRRPNCGPGGRADTFPRLWLLFSYAKAHIRKGPSRPGSIGNRAGVHGDELQLRSAVRQDGNDCPHS